MKDVEAHICPTCGGQLRVDIERQMYECPFCGVTFDYDYFREESVLGIAARALKSKEFDSADSAYDFMLEKEPDNFEALRGKALVAMDITKIDDIRHLDLYSKVNYESAYKAIDRGISSSAPSDREYFTTMKDIVDAGHEYIGEEEMLKTQETERDSSEHRLFGYLRERDSVCIYTSPKFGKKKAAILTIVCYVICLLVLFLGFKLVTRNPYAKPADRTQYTTEQSAAGNDLNALGSFSSDQRAQEREEKRQINYEKWEKNHEGSNTNLMWIMGIATFIYVLIVFLVFMCGKDLNVEISKLRAKVDEQKAQIDTRKEKMTELKDRIDRNYKLLCELHPGDE